MLLTNSTKNQIAEYLCNSFELRERADRSEFYCVEETKLTSEHYKLLLSAIQDIHNNMPNDTEYNWIHSALCRLTGEDLDNTDISDIYCDFELIYTKEIIDAINYLDIDITERIYESSISDVVNEAFLEYMSYAISKLYSVITQIEQQLS